MVVCQRNDFLSSMVYFEIGHWTARKKWNLFVGKKHVTFSEATNFCESNNGRLPCPERRDPDKNTHLIKIIKLIKVEAGRNHMLGQL